MKPSASLLALAAAAAAAVPALSAGPSDSARIPEGAPGPSGGGGGGGGGGALHPPAYWRGVVLNAIEDHIALAKLAVSFIANNFEDPPRTNSRAMRDAMVIIYPSPGVVRAYDVNLDAARVFRMMRSEGISETDVPEFQIERGSFGFRTENFNVVPTGRAGRGRHVHFLSDNTHSRAKKLWKFFSALWVLVDSRPPEQKLPRVPDVFRVDGSGLPNLRAEFTSGDVRELLLSVAENLPGALYESFPPQNPGHGDFFNWVRRLKVLDAAISDIQLYDSDPLALHGQALGKLFGMLHGHDGSLEYEADLLATEAEITGAANAAKRAYGPKQRRMPRFRRPQWFSH